MNYTARLNFNSNQPIILGRPAAICAAIRRRAAKAQVGIAVDGNSEPSQVDYIIIDFTFDSAVTVGAEDGSNDDNDEIVSSHFDYWFVAIKGQILIIDCSDRGLEAVAAAAIVACSGGDQFPMCSHQAHRYLVIEFNYHLYWWRNLLDLVSVVLILEAALAFCQMKEENHLVCNFY